MSEPLHRQPHAALDLQGRVPKAEKISRLLALPAGRPLKLLEIGTGSGAIAHYFARRDDLQCDVHAVDVLDQRQTREGYAFQLVGGVQLPYADGEFDVVISNHVIEHVGALSEQQRHLQEIARVLRPGGKAYLASPNRWQMVEPHYHLAFLSWLPRAWRTPYLRAAGKGALYDCEPLRLPELERLLERAGLEFSNACVTAIRMMVKTEQQPSRLLKAVASLPDALLRAMQPVSPTHVYLLSRKASGERSAP